MSVGKEPFPYFGALCGRSTITSSINRCPPKASSYLILKKNFGFAGETTVVAPGINAKMNEFQAALGMLQLNYVDQFIERRKRIVQTYREGLTGVRGIRFLEDIPGVRNGYSYFPISIDPQEYGRERDQVYLELKEMNILTRLCFYPHISQFPAYKELESSKPEHLPVAQRIASEVLCLPLYPDLEQEAIQRIVGHLQKPSSH